MSTEPELVITLDPETETAPKVRQRRHHRHHPKTQEPAPVPPSSSPSLSRWERFEETVARYQALQPVYLAMREYDTGLTSRHRERCRRLVLWTLVALLSVWLLYQLVPRTLLYGYYYGSWYFEEALTQSETVLSDVLSQSEMAARNLWQVTWEAVWPVAPLALPRFRDMADLRRRRQRCHTDLSDVRVDRARRRNESPAWRPDPARQHWLVTAALTVSEEQASSEPQPCLCTMALSEWGVVSWLAPELLESDPIDAMGYEVEVAALPVLDSEPATQTMWLPEVLRIRASAWTEGHWDVHRIYELRDPQDMVTAQMCLRFQLGHEM